MQVSKQAATPSQRRRTIPVGILGAAGILALGLVVWLVQRQGAEAPAPATTPTTQHPAAEAAAEPGPAAAPQITTTEISARQRSTPNVTITSRDGSLTFRVPEPVDPDFADYQAMLQHPSYRSSLEGRQGYALPYDPEWRSVVAGKRQVPAMQFDLSGGAGSMQQFAQALLAALRDNDGDGLLRLRVARNEFETLLWPEFPQSRPYLRIDPEDAWVVHHTSSASAVANLLQKWGGRDLELVGIDYGDAFQYTNFTLFREVKLRVRVVGTEDMFEITEVPAIVGCNGQFKAYSYRS